LTLIKPDAANSPLSEQVKMRDTTPLFLPTEHNAAATTLPRREPGRAFLDRDTLKLSIGEGGLNLSRALPPVVALGGKSTALARPEDVLTTDSPGEMLMGFGRIDIRVAPMPPRGGFIEVIATATGHTVLAQSLPAEVAPPTDKPWQPMEFLAAVDPAGLVGPLLLTDDSRVEEVNVHFRNYLVRTFLLGERLPPGFYRVIIGP
jgi:hypothetical protein